MGAFVVLGVVSMSRGCVFPGVCKQTHHNPKTRLLTAILLQHHTPEFLCKFLQSAILAHPFTPNYNVGNFTWPHARKCPNIEIWGRGGGSWNMLTKRLSVAIIIPYTVGHARICYTWTEKTDASKASARPRFCGLYVFLAANPAPTRFLSMGPFCRQRWLYNAKNDDITQVFYLLLTKGWSF